MKSLISKEPQSNNVNDKKKHYAMVIDLRRCVGCDACTIACKQENLTPPGVYYNLVMKKEVGSYPNVRIRFTPRPCFQCENPPCTEVCPVGATYKREEDGIVVIDYDKCIGCRYCMTACPYGARYFDFGEDYYDSSTTEYVNLASPEYNGKYGVRKKGEIPIGVTRKCHFCLHRLEKGLEPACVQTCMGKARFFGDLNDPNSEIAKMVIRENAIQLKKELGTEPSVYYLL